ncbi:MAG: chloride channel protein [Gammaproteobacteria bacterium]|nr:chloride channel protein [Gammaproteobacteria bacterium]
MTEEKKYKNLDWTMARTVILAIIIGLIAALAAKALLLAIQYFSIYLHPIPLDQLSKQDDATLSLIDIISLSGMGLVVGLLTYYLMPNRANRGLSHVIEDIHFNHGQTGVKEGFAVGLISAASIGAGASVGRYGPAVHMGAAAGSGLGSLFKLQEQEKLTLACAGIAAAIAASFSAPLAAVIFVQEVVLRQWRLYQFIPTAAAAVAGSELAQLLGVNFNIPSGAVPDIVNSYEFLFFGIVGIACGALSIAFNHALPKGVALGAKIKIDNRLKPALGGLVLAMLGFYYPSILGLGGYMTTEAIAGNIALQLCLILLVLKFFATIVSFSFGFNGGVFGPALFMGAMLGAAIGITVELTGIPISSISLYAIAGMGAMVAGIVGAVMASIIALIEMTGKLSPSLPLLFSVTCAYVVIYLYSQSSLLVRQLNGRGKNPFVEIKARDKKYEGVDNA